VGGYLHDGCCGHWGTPPSSEGVIFSNKNKKILPLTGWSPKAVERNFLVHFGALGLAYNLMLEDGERKLVGEEHSQNLGTASTTTSSSAPYFAKSYPTQALYHGPLFFYKFGVLFVCVVISTFSLWSCKSGHHHLNFIYFFFFGLVLGFGLSSRRVRVFSLGGGGVGCFVFCISMGILK